MIKKTWWNVPVIIGLIVFSASSLQGMEILQKVGLNLKRLYESYAGHPRPKSEWSWGCVDNLRAENDYKQIGTYFYYYISDNFQRECLDQIKSYAEEGYIIGCYHFVRYVGNNKGTTEYMRLCFKYILITYILAQADYAVCSKVFKFYRDEKSTKGVNTFEYLMNKYYCFLKEHKLLVKEDEDNFKGIRPNEILENEVIPWFKRFYPDINAVKIFAPLVPSPVQESLYPHVEEEIDFEMPIRAEDVTVIIEDHVLPMPCWVRFVEFDKGIVGCGNTLIFNNIDSNDIERCEYFENEKFIRFNRPQEIRKQIDVLRKKEFWHEVFDKQEEAANN